MTVSFPSIAASLLSIVDRSAVYIRYSKGPSTLPLRNTGLDFLLGYQVLMEIYKKVAICEVEFRNEEIWKRQGFSSGVQEASTPNLVKRLYYIWINYSTIFPVFYILHNFHGNSVDLLYRGLFLPKTEVIVQNQSFPLIIYQQSVDSTIFNLLAYRTLNSQEVSQVSQFV